MWMNPVLIVAFTLILTPSNKDQIIFLVIIAQNIQIIIMLLYVQVICSYFKYAT